MHQCHNTNTNVLKLQKKKDSQSFIHCWFHYSVEQQGEMLAVGSALCLKSIHRPQTIGSSLTFSCKLFLLLGKSSCYRNRGRCVTLVRNLVDPQATPLTINHSYVFFSNSVGEKVYRIYVQHIERNQMVVKAVPFSREHTRVVPRTVSTENSK